KSVGPAEQGTILGVTQSVASLARAVGPFLAAVLINSSVAHHGADGEPHYMSDHSLFVTFWTGAAIMFVAFVLAFYFSLHSHKESHKKHKRISSFTVFLSLICAYGSLVFLVPFCDSTSQTAQ